MKILLPAIFLSGLFLPSVLWALPGAAEVSGPIPLTNPFALARLRNSLAPDSPVVIETQSWRLAARFFWSNSFTGETKGFRVDAEERVLDLGLQWSPGERSELSFHLPMSWRGGGILDSAIGEWHELFGLPGGGRHDAPRNDYSIEGVYEDGSSFDLVQRSTHLGDLRLRFKSVLLEESESLPVLSIAQSLALPTGAEGYGQDAVDGGFEVLLGKSWSLYGVYAGAGYVYLADPTVDELRYLRHQWAVYGYGEYRPSKRCNVFVGLVGYSKLLDGVLFYPDYSLYLDVGFKLRLRRNLLLEFLLREDPAPGEGTADVVFLTGLVYEGS